MVYDCHYDLLSKTLECIDLEFPGNIGSINYKHNPTSRRVMGTTSQGITHSLLGC
jgi:hypothetical protein